MKKQIISIVLALSVLLALILPAPVSAQEEITFAPDEAVTRGKFVYYLWQQFGCPEPLTQENPYTDISEEAYFYAAAVWAAETDIYTADISMRQFMPDRICSRSDVVITLWKAYGKEKIEDAVQLFRDVPERSGYFMAVAWAYSKDLPIATHICGEAFYGTLPCLFGHITGEGVSVGHDYEVQVTDPTCTESGYSIRICTICGIRVEDVGREPLGHTWGEWSVTREETAGEPGEKTRICELCGTSETVTFREQGDTVKFDPDEIVTRAKFFYYLWQQFGCPDVTMEEHSFIDLSETDYYYTAVLWAVENNIAAGTGADQFSPHSPCTRAQVATFLWRAYGRPEPESVENPFPDVSVQEYYDSAVRWAYSEGLPIAAHICGEKFCPLDTCVFSYITGEGRRAGHSYESVVTEPTCTVDGYTAHTCTVCGESYTDSQTVALGHTWDAGTVTTEPTADADGVKTFTCTVCSATRTESISAIEHIHSYDTVVTEPTCTEGGYTTFTCLDCGESYQDCFQDALGHSLSEWKLSKAPTCTGVGTEDRFCLRCEFYEYRLVEPTGGHVPAESVVIEPTCIAHGYTSHKCAKCGHAYKTDETSPLGHSFPEWVITEATCTEGGSTESTCERCGFHEVSAVPPIGHFYATVVTHPTCTEPGFTTHTCSRCGDSYVDSHVDPHHTFRGWKVVTEPTEQSEGEKTRSCIECDAVERQSIKKIQPSNEVFEDVKEEAWFTDQVTWAVTYGITAGTGADTFSPDEICTRAQVVTFLWRAVGCPDPVSEDTPFVDIRPEDYYYDAVLWAVENNITAGVDSTHFDPGGHCQRGQVVTFLWRAAGRPEAPSGGQNFHDVKNTAYYYQPVLWAVDAGITLGTGNGRFAPDQTCTRAEIVTFLFRAFVSK